MLNNTTVVVVWGTVRFPPFFNTGVGKNGSTWWNIWRRIMSGSLSKATAASACGRSETRCCSRIIQLWSPFLSRSPPRGDLSLFSCFIWDFADYVVKQNTALLSFNVRTFTISQPHLFWRKNNWGLLRGHFGKLVRSLPLYCCCCQKMVRWRYPRGIKSFKTCFKGMKNAFQNLTLH